jgi:hypothetical protein
MSDDRTAEVLDKIRKIAAMADCPITEHDDKTLVVNVGTSEDRTQVVFITHSGQTPDDHDIISFFSPCAELGRGVFGGMSKKVAIDLLRRNSQQVFSHFALYDFGGETDMLMVCSDQLIDTMDVEEFETHLQYVAMVADAYEYEHSGGADEY